MRGPNLTPEERAQIAKLHKIGWSATAIGKAMGRERSCVKNHVARLNRRPFAPPYKPERIVSVERPRRTFDELLAAVEAGEVTVVEIPLQPRVEMHPHGTLGGVSSVYDG